MPEQPEKKQSFNNFIKFSSLGIQMAATIGVMAFMGHWLDGYFNTSKPFVTLTFLLLGTILSIISLIRQLK